MARLILAAVVLVLLAQFAVPLAYALQPILEGFAVLALALVGLWLIASAHFAAGCEGGHASTAAYPASAQAALCGSSGHGQPAAPGARGGLPVEVAAVPDG